MAKTKEICISKDCQIQSLLLKKAGKDEINFENLVFTDEEAGIISGFIKNETLLKVSIGDVVTGALIRTSKAGKTDQPKFCNLNFTDEQVGKFNGWIKNQADVTLLIEVDTEGQFQFMADDDIDGDSDGDDICDDD